MIMSGLIALSASLSVVIADDAKSTNLEEARTLDALAMLDQNPSDFIAPNRRLQHHQRVRQTARLADPVYDARFVWGNVTGRNTSVLVEYRDSCEGSRYGRVSIPSRADQIRNVKGSYCTVDELYIVPSEAHARSLALRILVDEARGEGMDLPSSNAEAAQILIDRSNASG